MVINIKGRPKNVGLVHHDDILALSDRILPPILICLLFILSLSSAKNGKHQDSSQVRFANMRRSVSENEDGFEQKHQRKKTFNFPNVKKRYCS